jgi:hypothetical protein
MHESEWLNLLVMHEGYQASMGGITLFAVLGTLYLFSHHVTQRNLQSSEVGS